MAEPAPFHGDLTSTLSNMEDDVYNVKRWGDVLIVMSASSHLADHGALSAIGNVLHDLGRALEDQFQRVWDLSHPPT